MAGRHSEQKDNIQFQLFLLELFTKTDYNGVSMNILEYKSIGHPDSLTDYVAEEVSKFLNDHYMKKYGEVKHYNVDNCLFQSGTLDIGFNKCTVLSPPIFYLGGNIYNGNDALNEELFGVIGKAVRHIFPKLYIDIRMVYSSTSDGLNHMSRIKGCNDTSFAVGFYPFTTQEYLLLRLKDAIYGYILRHPVFGLDFKIMMVDTKEVIISIPQKVSMVTDCEQYHENMRKLKEFVQDVTRIENVYVNPECNTADDSTCWLVNHGSSIENGDSGSVGRGNNHYGFISSSRPSTKEAYCGKNSVSHIGKIYQDWAMNMAKSEYEADKHSKTVVMYNVVGNSVDYPVIDIMEE